MLYRGARASFQSPRLHGATPILASLALVIPRSDVTLTAVERLWAYITLGTTGIITEEAAPLVGGLMAHNGHLSLFVVGVAITIGTWSADILLYYLGRWRGEWLRNRWPRLRTFILRVFQLVRRHPWRCALSVRFAYGLRLTLPLACGAARVPFLLYLVGSGISAAAWAFLFTFAGWGFGEASLRVLGHMRRYEVRIALLIVIVVALAFWLLRRRHVEEEVVHALERGDPREEAAAESR